MAADYTASRIGQVNGAGDPRALFLKKFSGEVINSLPDTRETLGMNMEKTLRNGKSYQFPYTGRLHPKYHLVGTSLDGQVPNQNERVIGLDDLMTVDRFTPKIDKWMQHFDDRKPYADQMSEALATTMDRHIFMEGILGAREGSVVDGNDATGTVITSDKFQLGAGGAADAVELAQAIKAACKEAAAGFKKKRVPASLEKILYIDWDTYFTILDAVDTNGFSLFNKDYASGNIEEGMLPPLYGIKIKGANHLPTWDLTGITGQYDTTDITGLHPTGDGVYFYHKGDFSKTVGLIMCKGAVGTVKASDITMEMDPYQARYKGQLITADYLAGHGWLRPEFLVELSLDTLTNP